MSNMTTIDINLSQYPDRFKDKKISFTEGKPAFIFGRNGTGKTTITNAIIEQYRDSYDVRVFKDFENVAENKQLNAIALGEENSEIQGKINDLNRKIDELNETIIDDDINYNNNLCAEFKKSERSYNECSKKIEKFFTNSAAQITRKCNLGRNYNKNNFKDDIKLNPVELKEDELKNNNSIIKEDKKEIVNLSPIEDYELKKILTSANEIIRTETPQPTNLPELSDNPDKQNFARQGMRLHKPGDKCSFCGSIFEDNRWNELSRFFNEELAKTEKRINHELDYISGIEEQIYKIKRIEPEMFYGHLLKEVSEVNNLITSRANERKIFLSIIKGALLEKQKSPFVKLDPIKEDIPKGFEDINNRIKQLVDDANNFTNEISERKTKAEKAIRLSYVAQLLKEFDYTKNNEQLSILKSLMDSKKEEIEKIKEDIRGKKEDIKDLISKTKNEQLAATKINQLLKQFGINSFSLELVQNPDNKQKGQYQILGYNGKLRNVENLSRGEMNIVAFLYFIFKLDEEGNSSNPRIIIFDDPMTSNDDVTQYLMISELQRIYLAMIKKKGYFIVLTHNCHFYLNVRKSLEKFYKKYDNIHLLSDGNKTSIQPIDKGDCDLHTSYELLWIELKFLYVENKPALMISCCRRICETFEKFNGIKEFYKDSNKSAKKLFDVNVHSIDDLDSEQSGKTKEEIIEILKELFRSNNAEDHFTKYWEQDDNSNNIR